MYNSSDGTKKDVTEMNYEYLVNALSKNMRDIFGVGNVEEFNKMISNIQLLYNEIYNRIDKFLSDKMDSEEWL